MKAIKFWKCRKCNTVKARSEFPKHIDANTPCTECQAGLQAAHSSTDTPQTQQVTVHRWGFQRRHSTDNREPSGE